MWDVSRRGNLAVSVNYSEIKPDARFDATPKALRRGVGESGY